jgi:hypothetical protein
VKAGTTGKSLASVRFRTTLAAQVAAAAAAGAWSRGKRSSPEPLEGATIIGAALACPQSSRRHLAERRPVSCFQPDQATGAARQWRSGPWQRAALDRHCMCVVPSSQDSRQTRSERLCWLLRICGVHVSMYVPDILMAFSSTDDSELLKKQQQEATHAKLAYIIPAALRSTEHHRPWHNHTH